MSMKNTRTTRFPERIECKVYRIREDVVGTSYETDQKFIRNQHVIRPFSKFGSYQYRDVCQMNTLNNDDTFDVYRTENGKFV
jgi:hypothetical protein